MIYGGQMPPSYELLWVRPTSGGLGEQLGVALYNPEDD